MFFKSIRKLWHYFSFFVFSKKVWNWPRKSQVLIFDTCTQEIFLNYFQPWHPEMLHLRGEQLNMRVFLSSLLKGGRLKDAYIDCFIKKVQPRLIVSFIDNNRYFYTISNRHPNVKTLFVQNGLRSYYSDIFEAFDTLDPDITSAFFVDYMLTFGSVIGGKYSRYIKGSVLPMGSVTNNHVPKSELKRKGVIAFVSQWHHKFNCVWDGTHYTEKTFAALAEPLIIPALVLYARENNKRLTIVRRSRQQSDLRSLEEAYFREILGHEPEFLDPPGTCRSYLALDAADVVVSVDSTLAYESIARGNKTGFFSTRDVFGYAYGWPGDFPDEGPFWTNNPNPDSFVRILDYLFKVDDMKWNKDLEDTNFSSLMVYDPGNSVLKKIIEKELGDPPKTKNITASV